jgi:rhamnulose-1-phosphate aldolase/alcohol dehydrogenase
VAWLIDDREELCRCRSIPAGGIPVDGSPIRCARASEAATDQEHPIMTDPASPDLLDNRWDDAKAAGLSEPELLLYRSNLLGSDKRITNFGGGNTSAKVTEKDLLTGQDTTVLWVKGSGGDLGSMKLDGFATLYQDKLEALKGLYRGLEHEDEMVGYLPHCTFNLNARAASIDTPLHAYVPYRHVDHMHPDAIIAIAASANSKELTQQIFGDEIGWLPWKRPGFELGLWLSKFATENPHAKGVLLGSHGLFTWADSSKETYELTLQVINKAIAWLGRETAGKPVFGGAASQSLDADKRRAVAASLMPQIRGRIGKTESKLGHFDDQPAVLEFVNSAQLRSLAALGTSCPDHFLRTKIRPLVVDYDPAKDNLDEVLAGLDGALDAYRADYAAYYERCKHADSPAMRDPNPVVYLVPGVGMITFARDKATARIAGEFYVNAVNVMRPSRKPSTSSTGCSRRPSCSACRRRNRSPAGSPSSPAAPAASARPPPSAISRKARS